MRLLHRGDGIPEDAPCAVFIELSTNASPSRRHDGPTRLSLVTRQARNLSISGALEERRILVRDRDSKFSGAFDEVFLTEGLTVARTPVRAPQANAVTLRWVGTVRRECLDYVLIWDRRTLERVLGT